MELLSVAFGTNDQFEASSADLPLEIPPGGGSERLILFKPTSTGDKVATAGIWVQGDLWQFQVRGTATE